MKLLVSFLIIYANLISEKYASPLDTGKYSLEYFDKIIKDVKSTGAQWEAGHNFENEEELHNLLGSLEALDDGNHSGEDLDAAEPCIHKRADGFKDDKVGHSDGRPHYFDGLKEWKKCKSVGRVWNQGRCASDWVIAPTAAFTDRLCIASNATFQGIISPETPLACCKTCGWGCQRGYPKEVNTYFVKHGGVTGANYESNKGCQPYSVRPSRHAKYFQRVKAQTPKCSNQCTNGKYKKKFSEDIIKARKAFSYTCPFCAASELSRHGPITATMLVHEDFFTYKSGIYHHVTGKPIGKLTVKLVGYNDEDVNNRFWTAVNSWGKRWGQNGKFKIKRATGESMIDGSLQGVYVFSSLDESSSSSSSDDSDADDDDEEDANDESNVGDEE